MTKPTPSAGSSPEAGLINSLAPVQESLERMRLASERLSSIYTEIATEQANFLQRTVFDTLLEMRNLGRVRGPVEFLELSTEFAWQQAERSLKALGEIGSEACSCWFDALKAAPALPSKPMKGRALH